ncbi:glycine-rich domain-containing protein [Calothrix sp. PCC 6303]|uniref:glycine-rich domain-containing protein n=1 Tax=Calothrix sp. PCC 6303 TaxID=1170562 RepID=UPI0002A0434A|nr:glycine-rich domain-containing protein-like [Calothrix sp. PCC 6303]AFY99357.1 hypothetical protein Cal6303_0260 [Calothrix sp. PCC 6303]
MNTIWEKQLPSKTNEEFAEKITNFFRKLNQLDFRAISKKLTSNTENFQWTEEETKSAIHLYKMFLCLHFLFPNTELVPTVEIDRVWHTHILLNTAKYIEDCQELYGYILHHYSPADDDLEISHKFQKTAFDLTKHLFLEIFGIDICHNVAYHQGRCLILPQHFPQLQRSACLTIPKS